MLQILIYRLVLALLALNQRQQHQLCQRQVSSLVQHPRSPARLSAA